jgi:hypothetical protein
MSENCPHHAPLLALAEEIQDIIDTEDQLIESVIVARNRRRELSVQLLAILKEDEQCERMVVTRLALAQLE